MPPSESEFGQLSRFLGVTAGLFAWCVSWRRAIEWRYGKSAGRRFTGGMVAALTLQQLLVWLTLRHSARKGKTHRLSVVDAMPLSRGGAGALLTGLVMSGVRDRRGRARWLAWIAVLYGAILCD